MPDSRQFRAALDALRECTLEELHEIELFRFRAIKTAVALRDLRVVPKDEPDPEYLAGAVDGKQVQDDDDEPDDQDKTPLEVVGPPSEADVIEAQAFFRADAGHDEPRGPH